MYIINKTTGSVLLPDGRDLVTWLYVEEDKVEDLKRYEGTLLEFSKTKPDEKEAVTKEMVFESAVLDGGSNSLADLVKKSEAVEETPETEETKQTSKSKKAKQ